MTQQEFENLKIGDTVRRAGGTTLGRVFKVERERVRVTWLSGVRMGTRTTLHFKRLDRAIIHGI